MSLDDIPRRLARADPGNADLLRDPADGLGHRTLKPLVVDLDVELDERTFETFCGHTHAYTFNRRVRRDALALLENSQMAGLKPVWRV